MTDINPHEFYATPAWAVDAIVRGAKLPLGGMVLDAGCGEGAISHRLIEGHGVQAFRFAGFEIDEARAATCRDKCGIQVVGADFLDALPDVAGYSLAISNPPFSKSLEFVQRMLEWTKPVNGTVAALLRLNFLASGERRQFLHAHPPDVYVLDQRPSFAVSVRCKPKEEGKASCGWTASYDPGAETPKACPTCGEKTSKSTSDASDYGWFLWGPGRGGHWYPLDREAA